MKDRTADNEHSNPVLLPLVPEFTNIWISHLQFLHFQKFLLEVIAIGRKNAGWESNTFVIFLQIFCAWVQHCRATHPLPLPPSQIWVSGNFSANSLLFFTSALHQCISYKSCLCGSVTGFCIRIPTWISWARSFFKFLSWKMKSWNIVKYVLCCWCSSKPKLAKRVISYCIYCPMSQEKHFNLDNVQSLCNCLMCRAGNGGVSSFCCVLLQLYRVEVWAGWGEGGWGEGGVLCVFCGVVAQWRSAHSDLTPKLYFKLNAASSTHYHTHTQRCRKKI